MEIEFLHGRGKVVKDQEELEVEVVVVVKDQEDV